MSAPTSFDVKVGYPDRDGRSRVEERHAPRRLLGYVVEQRVDRHGTARRWFPEDARTLPIEGTFRTKWQAVDAVLEEVRRRG